MTDKTRKSVLLAVLILLALGGAAFWSYDFLDTQHSSALAAQRDLTAIEGFAQRIEAARQRPKLAAEQEQVGTQTTALIEKAATAAGILPDTNNNRFMEIKPQPAQRVGETNFREKPTVLKFKNVTLEQVVRLMHALAAGEPALHAKSLQLSCMNADDTTNWSAEITLTYLIYDEAKSQ